MSKQQLGKAVGILLAFERECQFQYEDLRAFYAPSECLET